MPEWTTHQPMTVCDQCEFVERPSVPKPKCDATRILWSVITKEHKVFDRGFCEDINDGRCPFFKPAGT